MVQSNVAVNFLTLRWQKNEGLQPRQVTLTWHSIIFTWLNSICFIPIADMGLLCLYKLSKLIPLIQSQTQFLKIRKY